MTLKTFYEMGLLSELSSQIDAYSHFIVKNKKNLSQLNFVRVKNFLKYLNKLYKLKENPVKKNLSDLRYELEKETNTIERLWMLEKISEIESSR